MKTFTRVNQHKIEILEGGVYRSVGHASDYDFDVDTIICEMCALGLHPETGEIILLWLFANGDATINRNDPHYKRHYKYFS